MLFVGHRLSLNQLKNKAIFANKVGYRLAATSAGKTSVSNSGGALALYRKHLQAWPVQRAPLLFDGIAHPTQSHGHDWVAFQVHLRKTVITIYVVYMTSSIGPTGLNKHQEDAPDHEQLSAHSWCCAYGG